MTFNARTMDLGVLDSLTQYPSIPTYHTLDPNPKSGMLLDGTVEMTGEVIGTEKVDGTNARLIMTPDGSYIIGSRTELLHGKGDLIANSKLGIVEALRATADKLPFLVVNYDFIAVYYFEVYGGDGQLPAAKHYTTTKQFGHRLFDIQILDPARLEVMTREQAASWRQHDGQTWLGESSLRTAAVESGLELTPRLFSLDASEVPTDIEKMHAFLGERLAKTNVALDDEASGKAEGIVLRSANRSVIAKARFEDYERTARKRAAMEGRSRKA